MEYYFDRRSGCQWPKAPFFFVIADSEICSLSYICRHPRLVRSPYTPYDSVVFAFAAYPHESKAPLPERQNVSNPLLKTLLSSLEAAWIRSSHAFSHTYLLYLKPFCCASSTLLGHFFRTCRSTYPARERESQHFAAIYRPCRNFLHPILSSSMLSTSDPSLHSTTPPLFLFSPSCNGIRFLFVMPPLFLCSMHLFPTPLELSHYS